MDWRTASSNSMGPGMRSVACSGWEDMVRFADGPEGDSGEDGEDVEEEAVTGRGSPETKCRDTSEIRSEGFGSGPPEDILRLRGWPGRDIRDRARTAEASRSVPWIVCLVNASLPAACRPLEEGVASSCVDCNFPRRCRSSVAPCANFLGPRPAPNSVSDHGPSPASETHSHSGHRVYSVINSIPTDHTR